MGEYYFFPFWGPGEQGHVNQINMGGVASFKISPYSTRIRKSNQNSNNRIEKCRAREIPNYPREDESLQRIRNNDSIKNIASSVVVIGLVLGRIGIEPANAFPVSVRPATGATTGTSIIAVEKALEKSIREDMKAVKQSPGWELARQKRNVAIKKLEDNKVLEVKTDEMTGTQTLALPWMPGAQIPYKSLPNNRKLTNEMLAGACGEVLKDCLLYSVDTIKTRRQSQKKTVGGIEIVSDANEDILSKVKGLYAGFPVVLTTSIFQGGTFFFVKNIVINLLNQFDGDLPSFVEATVPILFATMGYWIFRTPSEVIKTNIQTGQTADVKAAIEEIKRDEDGFNALYSNYPIVLWLDIPFQIINFVLYGLLGDYMRSIGVEASVATRLFAGITCGCVGAFITCPLDVAKTRIISRKKELSNQKKRRQLEILEIAAAPAMAFANDTNIPVEMLEVGRRDDTEWDPVDEDDDNSNVLIELPKILKAEGVGALFLGVQQRLLYTGLANG